MIEQAPFVALIDTALDRYVARAPLYIGCAIAIAVIGSGIIFFGNLASGEIEMLTLVLSAPLHAIVALGTSTDVSEDQLSIRTIVFRALRKWPELLLCQIITAFSATITVLTLFDNSWVSAIALIPLAIAWGAISLCDVIIAINEPRPASHFFQSLLHRLQFFGGAVTDALGYALRVQNFTRLASLAIIQLPCIMLQLLIQHQIELRHLTINIAWISFFITCLADGVYEAIFTQTLQRLRSA